MSTETAASIFALLAILNGLWLLRVLKQKNKSRKPVIISMAVLAILKILYYIALNVTGQQTLITSLISMISLGTAMFILYGFAMSLVVLITFKR